jgi:hypothetical protein
MLRRLKNRLGILARGIREGIGGRHNLVGRMAAYAVRDLWPDGRPTSASATGVGTSRHRDALCCHRAETNLDFHP